MGLIQTLTDILRIPSPSGEEKELCDWIEARLQNAFTNQPFSTIQRVQNSLILTAPKVAGRPDLVLAGHIDTVQGKGYGDQVRLEGDKLIGLGASDMKSGLAVMLELAQPAFLKDVAYNLTFIFYHGEEGPDQDNGIHAVFELQANLKQAQLAIVLEPTDSTLQLGCMGSVHAELTFCGKRAHSARPWQGSNAIYLANQFLSKLAALEPVSKKFGELEFLEVITITQAHSGDNSRNVVPDRYKLNLNMRFCPGDDVAYARSRIVDLVQGQAIVEFIDLSPSASVPLENVLLKSLQSRFNLPIQAKQAYTDVAVFDSHGIPAINFGPGLTAQAHQEQEYVSISQLKHFDQLIRNFLCNP